MIKIENHLPFWVFIAVGYLLYANTFGNAWTYDDLPVIVKNADVRSLVGFFHNDYPGRPLREITYLLDYALFGYEPAGWHVQNIFWHGLNAFLVFVLALRLGGGKPAAWFAGLLYLAHPVHAEVVASISHRKDSLSLAFSMMAMLAYIKAFDLPKKRLPWIVASFVFVGVACLGKQNAVVVPVLFLAYEWVFVSREDQFFLKNRLVFCSLLLVGALLPLAWFFGLDGKALFLEKYPQKLYKMNHHMATVGAYFRMVLKSWVFMFSKLAYPVDLALEYVYPVPRSWSDRWVVGGILGGGVYLTGLFWALRTSSRMFFSLLWTGVFWLPTSNLFPAAYFSADRYLYAPSVGLALVVAFVLGRLWTMSKPLTGGVFVVLLSVISILTWQQNRVWRDDFSLWTRAVDVSPMSSPALTGLGEEYVERGETTKAINLFTRATMNWNYPLSYYNLALTYEELGQTRNAIRYYCFYVKSKGEIISKDVDKAKIKKHLYSEYGVRCD